MDELAAHFKDAANISSNSSNYVTSNETVPLQEDTTSEFIEKLSKVINEPASGSTSYNTAFDHTNIQEQNIQQEDVMDGSIITLSDDSSAQLHTSGYEFLSKEDLDECNSPVMTHLDDECQELISEAINDELPKIKIDPCSEVFDISTGSVNNISNDSRNEDVFDMSYEVLNSSGCSSAIVSEANALFNEISNQFKDEEVYGNSNLMNNEVSNRYYKVVDASGSSTSEINDDFRDKVFGKYKLENREVSDGYTEEVDISSCPSLAVANEREPLSYQINNDFSNEGLSQNNKCDHGNVSGSYFDSVGSISSEGVVNGTNYESFRSKESSYEQASSRYYEGLDTTGSSSASGNEDDKALYQNTTVDSAKGNCHEEEEFYQNSPDIIPPTPQEKCGVFNFHQLSKISEKTEFTTLLDTRPSRDLKEFGNIPEIKVSSLGSSPVPVPHIDLDQFEDSCELDNTFDEINRLLQQGADESEEAASQAERDDIPSNLKKKVAVERRRSNPTSGSFMYNSFKEYPGLHIRTLTPQKHVGMVQNFYSADKITKPSVEVNGPKTIAKSKFSTMESKIKPPSVNVKALFTKTGTFKPTNSNFKIPTKPIKKLNTPNKVIHPSLKNVVSPVGVYIKHSPKYCPLIKVPPHKAQSNTIPKLCRQRSPAKENVPVSSAVGSLQQIPTVIYKPAKTNLESEVRQINLPGSIEKLITPQVVTRHERRIEVDDRKQSVERRLLESDLSIDISNTSLNPDISILTHKQPFNLKKF